MVRFYVRWFNIFKCFFQNGGIQKNGGNNYPLRGGKSTLWEGGTRSSAFIYSSMLKNKGTTNNEYVMVNTVAILTYNIIVNGK